MGADLLLPLSELPGPVPAGAPVVLRPGSYSTGGNPVFIYEPAAGQALSAGKVAYRCDLHGYYVLRPERDRVALDLSPPPIDADGWPTRVDGMDVAARMLARAMTGEPDGCTYGPDGFTVTYDSEHRPIAEVHADSVIYRFDSERVPALADIDHNGEDADRRMLIALIQARVWEAPRG